MYVILGLQSNSLVYKTEEINYVIALGYYNSGDTKKSLQILAPLIQNDPSNDQFLDLQNKAEQKLAKGNFP